MIASQYKQFKECMRTDESDNPIWYAGFLFLQLTPRQCKEVSEILIERGFPIRKNSRGEYEVVTPSGLGIILE